MLPYVFFIFPLAFSLLAVRTNRYPYKVGVTFSCILIITFSRYASGAQAVPFMLIVAAFLFSIGGDFFLSHRETDNGEKPGWFIYGIALFFVAHIFYAAFAAARTPFDPIFFVALFIFFIVYSLFRLLPRVKGIPMKAAVTLYMVISCLSLSLAWSYNIHTAGNPFFLLGIGLIVFSDLCISEAELIGFTPPGKLILPTYYAAHMAITLGLVFI